MTTSLKVGVRWEDGTLQRLDVSPTGRTPPLGRVGRIKQAWIEVPLAYEDRVMRGDEQIAVHDLDELIALARCFKVRS